MGRKIFGAVWTTAVVVFLASLVFIMGISYQYFSSIQRRQLSNETELAARGVTLAGEAYFDNLEADDYRITWIDAAGNVLYDNAADSGHMENHLEREEVKLALETGCGEAVRYSNTLAHKHFYAAKRLDDGTILRLSIVQAAVWTLLLGFARPIVIVILIALILSSILASHLTYRIIRPINEIDPRFPEQYYGKDNYKEIDPLLRHIAAQNSQLRADHEKIAQTAMIRQEFTANVSHELKTPLQSISGYAELLENGMAREEDVKPFARKIRAESLRMTRLVEDIINLTRLDNGDAPEDWEMCDLFRIAQNAIDSLETTASAAGVALHIEGAAASVEAVPEMMYSIVYNLCDNAIKYNHPGGSVTVSLSQGNNHTWLTVKDTGIGIPEESIDRVFERFYRVDKSHSKEVGGTGLGLSIVKHAVMIHKGKVEIKSRDGGPTQVMVTLPNRQG